MNYLHLHNRLEADPDFAASIGFSNAFPADEFSLGGHVGRQGRFFDCPNDPICSV